MLIFLLAVTAVVSSVTYKVVTHVPEVPETAPDLRVELCDIKQAAVINKDEEIMGLLPLQGLDCPKFTPTPKQNRSSGDSQSNLSDRKH